jgi:hypothetical protein
MEMNENEEVAVTVAPFLLSVKRDKLIEMVKQRIASDRAMITSLHGRTRKKAEDEVNRMLDWLDTLVMRKDEHVELFVVEERATEELALQQEEEGDFPRTTGRLPVC